MIDTNNTTEFIGQIIDVFEDFLEEKGIDIDNDEKDVDNAAIIYGSDYDYISEGIEDILQNWGIIK